MQKLDWTLEMKVVGKFTGIADGFGNSEDLRISNKVEVEKMDA